MDDLAAALEPLVDICGTGLDQRGQQGGDLLPRPVRALIAIAFALVLYLLAGRGLGSFERQGRGRAVAGAVGLIACGVSQHRLDPGNVLVDGQLT